MKTKHLDGILGQIRDESVPECPDGVESRVLLRVRGGLRGQRVYEEPFWAGLSRLALRPGVVAALLVITASLGVVTTTVAASQFSSPAEKGEDWLGFAMIANPHILECHHCIPRAKVE